MVDVFRKMKKQDGVLLINSIIILVIIGEKSVHLFVFVVRRVYIHSDKISGDLGIFLYAASAERSVSLCLVHRGGVFTLKTEPAVPVTPSPLGSTH